MAFCGEYFVADKMGEGERERENNLNFQVERENKSIEVPIIKY